MLRVFNPKVLALGGVGAALLVASSSARAATFYFDDFDGGGGDLDNIAPDTRPGSETWDAGANFNANGTVTGSGSAFLPFVPQAGQIYTLSATFNTTNVNDNFLGIGFTRVLGNPSLRFFTPGAPNPDPLPVFWGMSRGTDATPLADQSFLGPGTAGGLNESTQSADTIAIVLDTTGASWTVQWFFNGNLDRTETVAPDNAINYVALTSSNSTGSVDNFSLTVVPEPASLGLAAIGFIGLLARRRGL
jgi:hypothetical protein